MKLLKILVMMLLAGVIASCSSTNITSSWREPNAKTTPYHNVMVWGILPEKDSATRRQIESHLVKDLVGKGYHAVSSLAVYAGRAYKKMSAAEVVAEFKQTGIDAVITLVMLDKQKEEKYYPYEVFNPPMNPNGNGNLDRYYSSVYDKVFTPGYYVTTTSYFWEANLFEVAADKLTYSVRTRSFDPVSTSMQAHENGLLIMKDMLKKKVILNHIPPEE